MQRATEAAVAAMHRADDYAAGGPPARWRAPQPAESTRQVVDDLVGTPG